LKAKPITPCFILQIFLMLLGIMRAAPPLPKSQLISTYRSKRSLAKN